MGKLTDYYKLAVEEFLRKPPHGFARSAYAVEVNPWTRRGDIEAALLFRGALVSAYGYIETRLGELAVRASKLEQYAALRSQFPYSTSKRMSFIREAFSFGPLKKFEKFAVLFLMRFEAAAELRHLVAHARMQVMPDWGVTFHDIPKSDEKNVEFRMMRYPIDEFENLAWKAAKLSRLCQFLLNHPDFVHVLPEV